MKIIKVILTLIFAAIVVLVCAFFVIGLVKPKVAFQTAVEVNKDRAQAWKHFTDESKTKEWLEGLKSIETISGEPLTAGSVFKITMVMDGREMVVTEKMTAVEPPEHFAFTADGDVLISDVSIKLTESGGKTKIVQDESVTGKNLFWKSVFAWCVPMFKENSQKNLDRLKAFIERQP